MVLVGPNTVITCTEKVEEKFLIHFTDNERKGTFGNILFLKKTEKLKTLIHVSV